MRLYAHNSAVFLTGTPKTCISLPGISAVVRMSVYFAQLGYPKEQFLILGELLFHCNHPTFSILSHGLTVKMETT